MKAPARIDWKAIDGFAIRRLVNDSRAVRPGDTFVAYPGQSRDGRDYIAEALANRAAGVLWESTGFAWNPHWCVRNLGMKDLRQHAGEIASRVHGRPSRKLWMIGVTGTNGKTSCSQWIAQALMRAGRKCAVVGTLGHGLGGALKPAPNTTPDALWLHAQLAEFARRGARAVAMEVSSIGLDQDRVSGVEFDVALFTNLTRDHLEYHHTMRRYAEAKARLFAWESLKHAVVNLDDGYGRELARRIRRPGLNVIGYGFSDARSSRTSRVTGSNLVTDASGVSFDVKTPWGSARVASPVLGRYNAYNLLGTLGVLLASGVTLRKAVAALAALKPVPGRLQRLGGGGKPLVVVDYAHTPDALKQVLLTLRKLLATNPSRLICVVGCGGERDRGKRPLMGSVAARHADHAVITSDNPRGEDPQAIIADIVKGVRGGYSIEPDRALAIREAIRAARAGDIVLLAGKGHERYQEVGGKRHPFSDVAQASATLEETWR